MKRIVRDAFLLGVAVISLKGCIFNSKVVPPGSNTGVYAQPTAPESLINNLQVSYRRREIDRYAEILAPDFKFQFQPIDANTIGTDFWTRDQDSTGTRALLKTTDVSEIRISLTYQGRDTTVNFPGTPLDSVKIRIVTTDLQVDQTDGTTWVVSDQQDMFFRKGLPENKENPNHWLLYGWNDLPSLSAAPGLSPLSNGAPASQGISLTWGGALEEALKEKAGP
jgi:hypothetical protein